jgi:hypothetical protein
MKNKRTKQVYKMTAADAAPELLAAAKKMVAHLDKWLADSTLTISPEQSKELYDGLKAAIEKAEGKK